MLPRRDEVHLWKLAVQGSEKYLRERRKFLKVNATCRFTKDRFYSQLFFGRESIFLIFFACIAKQMNLKTSIVTCSLTVVVTQQKAIH